MELNFCLACRICSNDWSIGNPSGDVKVLLRKYLPLSREVNLRFGSYQKSKLSSLPEKQGRIHGNPVADGWAGAVLRKPLGIQKCDGRTDLPTDRPTRQGVESRVRD